MFSLNRVHVIGYQTQPVQVRQTPGGTSVTDLNLVVPHSFRTDAGQTLEGKSFHVVTLWGPMAGVAGQFVLPGSQVFVSGRLQTDTWEDEQTREKRSKTKIVALDMILLDPKDGQMPAPSDAAHLTGCLNRADLIGNVTRDPEMRTTTSGQKVLTLGVATNDRWKNKASGELKERAEFHSVVVWGEMAEEVQRTVKKGNRLFVSGRVQTRSFETPAGAKRYATEVIADVVSLLGVKNDVALASVSNEAPATGRQGGSPFATEQGSPLPERQGAAVVVPEVRYESEIKVEDLPF